MTNEHAPFQGFFQSLPVGCLLQISGGDHHTISFIVPSEHIMRDLDNNIRIVRGLDDMRKGLLLLQIAVYPGKIPNLEADQDALKLVHGQTTIEYFQMLTLVITSRHLEEPQPGMIQLYN
ncbi:MAG: hypothetical protein AAF998_09370 [Bacteroidota bacterium]